MALAFSCFQMARDIKECGKITKDMVMEPLYFMTEQYLRECGSMILGEEMGGSVCRMVIS